MQNSETQEYWHKHKHKTQSNGAEVHSIGMSNVQWANVYAEYLGIW